LPDSYGKRQRDAVKARKAEAREARRIARRQRKDGGSVSPDDAPEGWSAGEPGEEVTPHEQSESEEIVDLTDPEHVGPTSPGHERD